MCALISYHWECEQGTEDTCSDCGTTDFVLVEFFQLFGCWQRTGRRCLLAGLAVVLFAAAGSGGVWQIGIIWGHCVVCVFSWLMLLQDHLGSYTWSSSKLLLESSDWSGAFAANDQHTRLCLSQWNYVVPRMDQSLTSKTHWPITCLEMHAPLISL